MKSRKRERGLTLVELIIAMAILAVAIMALVSSITSSGQIQQNTREKVIAYNAARECIEKMRVYAVGEIFSRYNLPNADGGLLDDSFFSGAHPGNNFHVPGLNMPTGAPSTGTNKWTSATGMDGWGQIIFPETAFNLDETYVDAGMGMPRDLDRDGFANKTNVSQSYKILPVKVKVRWKSIGGRDTEIEVNTFITDK